MYGDLFSACKELGLAGPSGPVIRGGKVRVKKRDGSYQELRMSKIQRGLLMAFQGGREQPDVMPLVHRVLDRVRGMVDPVSIERVSDTVEETLAEAGHTAVARRYMKYRLRRAVARAERLKPDAAAVPGYIQAAKYARHLVGESRRENKTETTERVFEMHATRAPDQQGLTELREAMDVVHAGNGAPSMRSCQFAGEALLRDNARMYNCSFTHINRWRVFQEVFYLLLCGCGVGYSVQWRHVDQLGELGYVDKRKVCHYVIDDDIRGWSDALGFLIECYTQTGCYPEFSYHKIRDEGELLHTSGGRAPGHLELKRALEAVRSVLDRAQGRALRPLECHDIICHLAEAVLSGGIRRSALISLFSPEDTEMLYCKTKGIFRPQSGGDPGLNAQREMANNSACLLREATSKTMLERIVRVAQGNFGCPGFYWTVNLDYGPNPCGEIGMWPAIRWCEECGTYGHPGVFECDCGSLATVLRSGWSFCNLTEVNCVGASRAELIRRVVAMAHIGTYQATYTSFEYLGSVSEEICRREALLGVGLTGIMDNPGVALCPGVLRECAAAAVAENKRLAARLGINPAARVTTVKPSGTASLWMGGVGSGIHPRWSRRYIQRITANPNEPPAAWFKAMNPHMVEVTPSGDWKLMFPIQCEDGAVTVKEQGWSEFMDAVFIVYENWIVPGTADETSAPGLTHNVSCTVTIRDGELDQVVERIWRERERVCAMSFAPYLVDQKFRYAPRQAVRAEDEGLWDRLIRLYKPVDWGGLLELADGTTLMSEGGCMGGACEVKI